MKANTKKITIIGISVLVLGIVYYFFKKKSNQTANTTTPATANTATTKSATATTIPATDIKATPTPTTTTTTSTTQAGVKFGNVVNVQNKAVLTGIAGLALKKGDKLKVVSPLYNGTFAVWYVYQGTGNVQNAYIETPFVGTTTGTVTKV